MKSILKMNTMAWLCMLTMVISCSQDHDVQHSYQESVAVANRGESSLSFIDATNNSLTKTLLIPGSEPMYVVYVAQTDKLYVGDRAQSQIHQIDPQMMEVERSISVGKGVFHMWANGTGTQLWVSADIDNAISVVDLTDFTLMRTIPLGIKPHDVFVSQDGTKAYVSVFTQNLTLPDSVYLFNAQHFTKEKAQAVGRDPHLFHLNLTDRLLVASQSGQVFALDDGDLTISTMTSLPGAHGLFATPSQDQLVIASITENKLYLVKSASLAFDGPILTTAVTTPHNVAINAAGNKVFVTHSGAMANEVTFYNLNHNELSEEGRLQTGLNPFGIAYFKRLLKP
ncbi:DNA-binding beta-propeller fold protein YncE [Dyadobacter jejuensis]|uniref:DNA-binding beta-propeller fold protein YncE n=2 Tax=Dyadobacter jejuensis TaxID=1082580 RepID=A0A316AJN2_9BACT|nr:DNA-binding beta-propeller fold protein YncE [Dyadobacter jejuensis]